MISWVDVEDVIGFELQFLNSIKINKSGLNIFRWSQKWTDACFHAYDHETMIMDHFMSIFLHINDQKAKDFNTLYF